MAMLGDHIGAWSGTNGFRLMPSDPLAERPAAAAVSLAAGGHLASLTYRWEHPDDGPQDGLLVVWPGNEDPIVGAVWADSWHQQPAPMSITGTANGPTIELDGDYGGGWRWRITLDAAQPDELLMQMDNVIPADAASADKEPGPYPVMVMRLQRA
jgi:hypothetical protein